MLRFTGLVSSSRAKQRLAVTVDDIVLTEFGFIEASSGIIVFMRLPGRDIHLTYYLRDGRVNCHITDSAKNPPKVWEVEMDAKELVEKVTRSFGRSVTRYEWNETYLMLQEPLMRLMTQFSVFPGESGEYNLLDTIRILSSARGEDDLLKRTRIRDGLKIGNRLGFQYSATQSYIVFPLDEKTCFRMNADIRRGFLGRTPFAMGIQRYMRYIETELTEEDVSAFLDESTVLRVKAAIETALMASALGASSTKT